MAPGYVWTSSGVTYRKWKFAFSSTKLRNKKYEFYAVICNVLLFQYTSRVKYFNNAKLLKVTLSPYASFSNLISCRNTHLNYSRVRVYQGNMSGIVYIMIEF